MRVLIGVCAGKASKASGTEQAVGRLVGALCAITARDDNAQSAMLASWISQVISASRPYPIYKIVTASRVLVPGIDWGCEAFDRLIL